MSFNMREWCPLHRQAVAALAAELADLRKFVSANVLNADEASRVAAKLSKADEKFRAVEASGESLILAFEADHPKESATGPGTDGGSAPAEPPATETPAPSTESPAGNSGSATPG